MEAAKALVLNRHWMPINVTSIRHAIALVYRGVAKVVNPTTYEMHTFESWADLSVARNEPCIRTVSIQIKIPEIIVLVAGDALPRREVPFSRRNLYLRDKYTCQYCGARPGSRGLSIDHVVPKSRGGRTEWTNCVLACQECNSKKGCHTLEEAGMRLIRQPRRPKWSPCISIPLTERRESWKNFISEQYWNVELID